MVKIDVTALYREIHDLTARVADLERESAQMASERERLAAIEAALETAVEKHRKYQEDVLDDLRALCRAVGEFDGARPESPHAVMLACIERAAALSSAAASSAGASATNGCTQVGNAGLHCDHDHSDERCCYCGEREP